jgi:hypothetical protein
MMLQQVANCPESCGAISAGENNSTRHGERKLEKVPYVSESVAAVATVEQIKRMWLRRIHT